MRLFAVLASGLLLASCGHGEHAFRQVQFCLNGETDIPRLEAVVRDIAQSNGLEFTDRSADAQAEAEEIAKSVRDMKIARPTIVLSAYSSDGFGFGAGNFPEAPFQVAFGFSKGKNEAEARKFANDVVARLARVWVIHEVPQYRGAFPLKKCDYAAHSA